jgi:hypothetical protein
METTLIWNEKEKLPQGDVYLGLVAVLEQNQNYEFHKKIGILSKEYNEIVLPAVYVFSENKWMYFGDDITEKVQYWATPTYPKN